MSVAYAQGGHDPTFQTQTLLYNEARTVYLGNLARRDNGVPPLRWNLQLTHAARWFSWDSTENRPSGFCGHQDTQGHLPDFRVLAFGYLAGGGAENSFCGYLSPEDAIQGWMNSSGHRANLLDPNSREIGLGYYRRDSDGRGYVTQDFGNDVVFAPIIIENEAISTMTPNVNLYIYDRSTGGGFAGLGTATQMMVSNNAYFSGANWEPYKASKAWALASGNGWREVYVKTRDKFNRTLTASDAIYLGANIPLNELGDAQMSTTQSQVTLYNLDSGALPQVQFSLGWMADDTDESFVKWWGNGGRVTDANAWGGTAFRLYPGDGESFVWDGDWKFPIKNVPLVAYFRLKVNNNTSSNEVARISVQGGITDYPPLSLKGTDFTMPDQYQEFALPFTYSPDSDNPFLFFKFWRSGSADIYVDAVSIFSTPQSITSPLTWSVPGNNYRGQGVWARYTDGSQFSEISEATTVAEPYTISGNTGAPGVTLSYMNGGLQTVLSDENGDYLIAVPSGWSGTVTPSLACHIFDPLEITYNNVAENQTNQNYSEMLIPCVLSITRASLNPTKSASVDFTVTFSETVHGLDTTVPFDDFSLYTPGISDAYITNVSGFDNTYTVTVSTGTGNGSIRLDVVDNDTIENGTGIPLGGVGQGNGDFTSGEIYTVNKGAIIPPSTPVLVSPANGALTTNYTPTLDWSNSTLTTGVIFDHYQIQVATESAFSNMVSDENLAGITNSKYTFSNDLTHNTKYYWRVRAFNLAGTASAWSPIWNFRAALTPPVLVAPNEGDSLSSLRPTFTWSDPNLAAPLATGYTIQISSSSTFSTISNTSNPAGTIYTPTVDLPKGKLYWRVRANGSNGPSLWTTRSYQGPNPPVAPVPSLPANATLTTDYTPLFKWSVLTIPASAAPFDHYQLQVATDTGFTSIVLDHKISGVTNNTFTLTTDLAPNTKYYWHVRGVNILPENGAWSTVRYFRTAFVPVTLNALPNGDHPSVLRPTFSWTDPNVAPLATSYSIQISIVSNFSTMVTSGTASTPSYTPTLNLPAGKLLYWRVRANGANGPSLWTTGTFTSPTPPSTTTLLLPANTSLNTNYLPLLKWSAVTLPAGTTFQYYQVQVDDNSDFSSAVLNDTSITNRLTPQFQFVTPLTHNSKFYWRVLAFNTLGQYSTSAVWSFRSALTPPTQVSPILGSNELTLRPIFDWEDINETGRTGYTIQISAISSFATITNTSSPVASTYTPVVDLPKNKLLYWRVQTRGTNGPSAWSEVRSFTSANSPNTPLLAAPVLNALNTTYTPLFKWTAVTIPLGTTFQYYHLQVDDNNDFSSPVIDDTSITNRLTPQFQVVTPLAHNTKFFWRVRAVNMDNEVSNWSAVWYIRTVADAPTLLSPANGTPAGTLKPTFDWDAPTGPITSYTIQVATTSAFTTLLVNSTTVDSMYMRLTNLPAAKTLYWRVKVNGPNGPSAWSTVFYFTTP